jgi:beta-glucosidase
MTLKPLALSAALLALTLSAQADEIDRKVDALLKKMTLQEKVGQLHQLSGREATGPESAKRASQLAEIKPLRFQKSW